MVHTLRSVGDMVWEVNPGRNYKKPDVIGRWIVEWASVTTSFKMESLVGMESKEVGKKVPSGLWSQTQTIWMQANTKVSDHTEMDEATRARKHISAYPFDRDDGTQVDYTGRPFGPDTVPLNDGHETHPHIVEMDQRNAEIIKGMKVHQALITGEPVKDDDKMVKLYYFQLVGYELPGQSVTFCNVPDLDRSHTFKEPGILNQNPWEAGVFVALDTTKSSVREFSKACHVKPRFGWMLYLPVSDSKTGIPRNPDGQIATLAMPLKGVMTEVLDWHEEEEDGRNDVAHYMEQFGIYHFGGPLTRSEFD